MRLASTVALISASAIAVTACTYSATPTVSPAFDVYSNYADVLPGRFALHVDSNAFEDTFKFDGFSCSAHKFPVDAREAFTTSVLKTFENLVETVELVQEPLSNAALTEGGYRAQLSVRSEDMDARLILVAGFWSASVSADVELVASITADSAEGRLLGTTVEGDDDGEANAGAACGGGAEALSLATSGAIKKLVRALGERLTNARRLRELHAGLLPSRS